MIKSLALGSLLVHSFTPTFQQHVVENHERTTRITANNDFADINTLKDQVARYILNDLATDGIYNLQTSEIRGWLDRMDYSTWQKLLQDRRNGQSITSITQTVKRVLQYSNGYETDAQWYLNLNSSLQEYESRIRTLEMIRDMSPDATSRERITSYLRELYKQKQALVNGMPDWNGLYSLMGSVRNVQGFDPSLYDQIHQLIQNGWNWNNGNLQSMVNTLVKSRDFAKYFGKSLVALTKMQKIFMIVVSGILAIMSALMAWLFIRNKKIKASKGIKVFIATTGSTFLLVASALALIALI